MNQPWIYTYSPSQSPFPPRGSNIYIRQKLDFKTKSVTRDEEGYYVITKGSIQEEGITIINIYAPKIGAPKHIKQILRDLKGEINSNTIIVGDFNTPLALMDRLSRQKITEETQGLNDIRLNGINKCIEQYVVISGIEQ